MNASAQPQTTNLSLLGAKKLGKEAKVVVLQSDRLDVVNSFDEPFKLAPKESRHR